MLCTNCHQDILRILIEESGRKFNFLPLNCQNKNEMGFSKCEKDKFLSQLLKCIHMKKVNEKKYDVSYALLQISLITGEAYRLGETYSQGRALKWAKDSSYRCWFEKVSTKKPAIASR